MELGAAIIDHSGSGGLIIHVNKVHHVTTINRVAKDLGEIEAWLFDVADEMDVEDGVMAFTDFGIENLIDLIKIHKDDPTIIERWNARK